MAEQKEAIQDKSMWIIIAGTTDSPKFVKPTDKSRRNGKYLSGITTDMNNVERKVNDDLSSYLYNKVLNMKNLKCNAVLNEIKSMCQEAKRKNALDIHIYYTGHGSRDTGNWCLSDDHIGLDDVIKIILTYWGNKNFSLYCDCCYSGNWAKQFQKYVGTVENAYINAASWPGYVAWDCEQGGYFTTWLTGLCEEKNLEKLNRCQAWIGSNKKFKLLYHTPMGLTID